MQGSGFRGSVPKFSLLGFLISTVYPNTLSSCFGPPLVRNLLYLDLFSIGTSSPRHKKQRDPGRVPEFCRLQWEFAP